MKKTSYLIWLMAVCCLSAQAQISDEGYYPFAQNDKTWRMQVGGIKENSYYNRIDGDTLIGGETWMKVYNYIAFRELNYSYFAAVRDVGKKVYAIAKGSNRPRLLYDFGLKVGSRVRCGVEGNDFFCLLEKDEQPDTLFGFKFVAYLKVERIDTIETYGLQRRRFKLTLLDPYEDSTLAENIVWVEGVGSYLSPFMPWAPVLPRDGLLLLKGCAIGKNYISSGEDFYKENNTNGIDNSAYSRNESDIIYNLSGHRMTKEPQKGVYIQNGRKYVK